MVSNLSKEIEKIDDVDYVPKELIDNNEENYIEKIVQIPLNDIHNNCNIREKYNENGIIELANSLKQYGLLEPIRVYSEGSGYRIIFGHRRYFAAQKAGFKNINCIICKKPDFLENILIQITENEQRELISDEDLAKYIIILKEEHKLTTEKIAKLISKSNSYVYHFINYLKEKNKYEKMFNEAGLKYTIRDANKLNNLSEEEVFDTVQMIVKNPVDKTKIIDNAKKRKNRNKLENISNIYIPKKYIKIVIKIINEKFEEFEINNNINGDVKEKFHLFFKELFSNLTNYC